MNNYAVYEVDYYETGTREAWQPVAFFDTLGEARQFLHLVYDNRKGYELAEMIHGFNVSTPKFLTD
jgi:hypothetical protein